MPKFLSRTYGQVTGFGDPDTSDLESAVIDLTPEVIERCRVRERLMLELSAQDESLWESYFWGGACEFYEFCTYTAEENGIIPIGADDGCVDGELIPLADESLLTEEPVRTECQQMVVAIDRATNSAEFGWCCYRKHCDVLVRTPRWSIEQLEAALTLASQPVPA